jgi:hypothetical protein
MKRYLVAILAGFALLVAISSAQADSVKQLGQQIVTLLKFNPPWEVVQCDETPSVVVGEANGYRLLLKQSTAISSGQDKQTTNNVRWPEGLATQPAIQEFSYMDLVLFTDQSSLPVNALSHIPWLDLKHRYYVKPIDMGNGHGYRWFGRIDIYWQEMLREKMNLSGGDDHLQLLDEGMNVEDKGGNTQNSMPQLFSKYGDKALPYLQAALHNKKVAISNSFSALAGIATPKATELLNSLYNGNNAQHSYYAAWALATHPRLESKPEYLDMLRKQNHISEVIAIAKKFGWQSDVRPILEQIRAEPKTFFSYRSAFETQRDLNGRPLNELIAAEKQVYAAAFSTDWDVAKHALELEQAKAVILANADKEASAMMALSFALPSGKGNNHSFEAVIATGKEIFSKLPPDVTKPILDSLRHVYKDEIVKLRKVAPEL